PTMIKPPSDHGSHGQVLPSLCHGLQPSGISTGIAAGEVAGMVTVDPYRHGVPGAVGIVRIGVQRSGSLETAERSVFRHAREDLLIRLGHVVLAYDFGHRAGAAPGRDGFTPGPRRNVPRSFRISAALSQVPVG